MVSNVFLDGNPQTAGSEWDASSGLCWVAATTAPRLRFSALEVKLLGSFCEFSLYKWL